MYDVSFSKIGRYVLVEALTNCYYFRIPLDKDFFTTTAAVNTTLCSCIRHKSNNNVRLQGLYAYKTQNRYVLLRLRNKIIVTVVYRLINNGLEF